MRGTSEEGRIHAWAGDAGDVLEDAETDFNELRITGNTIKAAASTTLPPHGRYAMIKNGELLTTDEFDSEITFQNNRYQFTVTSNDTFVVRGAARNDYVPGFEFLASMAFRIESTIPDGQFMPTNLTTEVGYAGLETQTINGAAITFTNVSGEPDKDGAVLHFDDSTVDARLYQSGTATKTIDKDDWDFDPYTEDNFSYTAEDWALPRFEGDLYGAGDIDIRLRLRNDGGEAAYPKLTQLSRQSEPVLDVFDLPVSIRFDAGTLDSSVDVSIGPINFVNRVGAQPDRRNKYEIITDYSVSQATSDTAGEVIRLYRKHPDRVEQNARFIDISALSPNADFRLETREVHRDHLTFPDGFDPDADSSWIAPDNQKVSETAIERADTGIGNITIGTHTDDDGQTKMRGKQNSALIAESGGGRVSATDAGTIDSTRMNELRYVALLGRLSDTTKSVTSTVIRWEMEF